MTQQLSGLDTLTHSPYANPLFQDSSCANLSRNFPSGLSRVLNILASSLLVGLLCRAESCRSEGAPTRTLAKPTLTCRPSRRARGWRAPRGIPHRPPTAAGRPPSARRSCPGAAPAPRRSLTAAAGLPRPGTPEQGRGQGGKVIENMPSAWHNYTGWCRAGQALTLSPIAQNHACIYFRQARHNPNRDACWCWQVHCTSHTGRRRCHLHWPSTCHLPD